MAHQLFNGSYGMDYFSNLQSLEKMYQKMTNSIPSFYQINKLPISHLSTFFTLHFQQWIEDYVILDCDKRDSGHMNYKLCYVLKNNIFVVIDEAQSSVKILYSTIKDELIKQIVHFFRVASHN